MCNPASFVVTEDCVYWSNKSNSHEDIIQEFKLERSDSWEFPKLLRVEISPIDRNWRLPIRQWKFKVDQDILPQWADKHEVESRVRKELSKWEASWLVIDGKSDVANGRSVIIEGGKHSITSSSVIDANNAFLDLCDSRVVRAEKCSLYCYGKSKIENAHNCDITGIGNSIIDACDSAGDLGKNVDGTFRGRSNVAIFDQAYCRLDDTSTGHLYGEASACLNDHSSIRVFGGKKVSAYGNSMVIWEKGDPEIQLFQNAVCIDKRTTPYKLMTMTTKMEED